MGGRCARSFVILADGGVRILWACGAKRTFPDEPSVDVELLRDRLAYETHHHRPHLHHNKE